jgi:hypothetical protein
MVGIVDIDNWWRHNGCYDREQASGIPYDGNASDFLAKTDEWWYSLSLAERKWVYCEFFNEE